jgi:hypothetical protein
MTTITATQLINEENGVDVSKGRVRGGLMGGSERRQKRRMEGEIRMGEEKKGGGVLERKMRDIGGEK